jgi:Fur family peroxide stress response transcriptional regulator
MKSLLILDYINLGMTQEKLEQIIDILIEKCKKKGMKITTQRVLIFRELVNRTKQHPTADEIYNALKNKVYGLSISTVYRALTSFEELGLVRKINTPDGKSHFELVTSPHGHFICIKCGKIFDINIKPHLETLKSSFLEEEGHKINECNFICYGICKDCLS